MGPQQNSFMISLINLFMCASVCFLFSCYIVGHNGVITVNRESIQIRIHGESIHQDCFPRLIIPSIRRQHRASPTPQLPPGTSRSLHQCLGASGSVWDRLGSSGSVWERLVRCSGSWIYLKSSTMPFVVGFRPDARAMFPLLGLVRSSSV